MANGNLTEIARITEEFLNELRGGRTPSITRYVRMFPQHAEHVRDALPALIAIGQLLSPLYSPGLQQQVVQQRALKVHEHLVKQPALILTIHAFGQRHLRPEIGPVCLAW